MEIAAKRGAYWALNDKSEDGGPKLQDKRDILLLARCAGSHYRCVHEKSKKNENAVFIFSSSLLLSSYGSVKHAKQTIRQLLAHVTYLICKNSVFESFILASEFWN